jgi:hypothetical protein
MYKDKRAEEEKGGRGQWAESNRPARGATGVAQGNAVGHQGIASPLAGRGNGRRDGGGRIAEGGMLGSWR